jgi:hypothetical protein
MKSLYITRSILVLTLSFSAITSMAFENKTMVKADTSGVVKTDTSGNASADIKPTAKSAEADTTWKPVRRLWGLTFGDFYYDAHADASNRGGETNYSAVPTYRNAFQFRRIYLGYDYDINRKFSVELLLSSEPTANTAVSGTTSISNGDNLADNKMSFFIKLANLKWKNVWSGTDFVIGDQVTPLTGLLGDQIWGYRSIERTVADFHKNNTYDVGAALRGVFDPATQNFGYDLMIGDNSQSALLSAANANTGFYKMFYGDVFAKFLDKKLVFDIYADYAKTAPATAALGAQDHSMLKGLAAYTTPAFTLGVEAYTQQIVNGVTDVTAGKVGENATVEAISFYTHGAIDKDKLGFFARYDSYTPDDDFAGTDVYTSNTNLSSYSPFTKEHFITAGLDYSPAKNVHFMPNIWFVQFEDLRDPTTTGWLPDSHILVYRLTFFVTFGK